MTGILKRIQNEIVNGLSEKNFALLVNNFGAIKGYKRRIAFAPNRGLIAVSDGEKKLYVCRRSRLRFYKRGIDGRLDQLARSYLLDRIPEPLQGAFIDCGANIGELGAYARSRGLEYHAFEPENGEADCCDLNHFEGKARTNRFGLWSHDGTLTFYSKPSSADSSLFETKDYADRHEISVRSLDSFANELGLTRVAVFKLEAEGAEPEILAGAKETLKITAYVTVDCGFERGLKGESTLIPVINALAGAGFQAVDWNPKRLTMLFKNTSL